MPLSNRVFDEQVEEFIKTHPYKNYLDIGCGAGKYGKIVKKYINDAHLAGIEVTKQYIDRYNLNEHYDEIINQPVEEYIQSSPGRYFDLVIMGDLIEHLFKSDGVDLLHFLVYRSKYIVILFPSKFVMYDVQGVSAEAHRSIWDESDFQQFNYQYYKKGHMNLVIIEGYLDDPEAIIDHRCMPKQVKLEN